MKRLITLIFTLSISYLSTQACSPIFSQYCETSQYYHFIDMHVFAGTIAQKNDNSIELNVLELLRGEESKGTITIWDGPIIDNRDDPICPHYFTGYAHGYGSIGDTIFCIVESIVEKQEDHDVIGDYRRPSNDYMTTFVRVKNGIVADFDYYKNFTIPYNEFVEYACHINIHGCTDADACNYEYSATVDDESCRYNCVEPEVNCARSSIYLCEPTDIPPPLRYEDFVVTDDDTPSDQIRFEVSESVQQRDQYTINSYGYLFADTSGNIAYCSQSYYMPDQLIEAPIFDKPINICQDELEVPINKPSEDRYYFYKNRNGRVGDFIASCKNCTVEHLKFNTTKTGTYRFWAKKVVLNVARVDGYRCESEASLLTINVNTRQTASLTDTRKTVSIGGFINLADMVLENPSGSWTGENVVSFISDSGETNFYFFPRTEGFHKIYYKVGSGDCKKSYILVIDVVSPKKPFDTSIIDDVTVAPNPTTGKVFIKILNHTDLEHTVSVFDIYGKLHVLKKANELEKNRIALDLSHLTNGIYFIEIRNPFSFTTKKLVLE